MHKFSKKKSFPELMIIKFNEENLLTEDINGIKPIKVSTFKQHIPPYPLKKKKGNIKTEKKTKNLTPTLSRPAEH